MLEKLIRPAFFLFLIFIPFGTKKFIFSFTEPINELNSAFLYGSDILLLSFLILFIFNYRKIHSNVLKNIGIDHAHSLLLFSLFLAFAAASIFFAAHSGPAIYQFFRLFLAAIGMLAAAQVLRQGLVKFKEVMGILAASALFQSLVGFLQFKFQRSVGLWVLGEPVGTVFTKGLATVRIAGGTLLRAFGTMPHANIYAAFLVIGLIAIFYFYLCTERREFGKRALISVAIFFIALALVLTFSRSGWITAGVATLAFLFWGVANKNYRPQTLKLAVVLVTCFLLLVTSFGWAIFPRAHLSMRDSSISNRYIFNLVGLEIIKDHPLGVGIGNQLQYAIDNGLYLKHGLTKFYSWQPIHNIYLLIASEIGIAGLLSFIIFLFLLVFRNPKSEIRSSKQSQNSNVPILKTRFDYLNFGHWNLFRNSSLEFRVSAVMLLALLLFGLFDHFFWDLQSGRLMFWLIIGLIMGLESFGKRESEFEN